MHIPDFFCRGNGGQGCPVLLMANLYPLLTGEPLRLVVHGVGEVGVEAAQIGGAGTKICRQTGLGKYELPTYGTVRHSLDGHWE